MFGNNQAEKPEKHNNRFLSSIRNVLHGIGRNKPHCQMRSPAPKPRQPPDTEHRPCNSRESKNTSQTRAGEKPRASAEKTTGYPNFVRYTSPQSFSTQARCTQINFHTHKQPNHETVKQIPHPPI